MNIGKCFESREIRQLLIDTSFEQAKLDGISVLEIDEGVQALGMSLSHDIDMLIDTFEQAHQRIASNIELRLQVRISRHYGIDYLLSYLEPLWDRKEFCSIDLYGDRFAQPTESFVPAYQKAKEHGLRLEAHIGEWGTSDNVIQGIGLLSLDEVQHGVSAMASNRVINYLLEHQIRLNITPSNNALLGRVAYVKEHPIVRLLRVGLDVTASSGDVLIFDSDISKECLSLYNSHILGVKEFDRIRLNSLRGL